MFLFSGDIDVAVIVSLVALPLITKFKSLFLLTPINPVEKPRFVPVAVAVVDDLEPASKLFGDAPDLPTND